MTFVYILEFSHSRSVRIASAGSDTTEVVDNMFSTVVGTLVVLAASDVTSSTTKNAYRLNQAANKIICAPRPFLMHGTYYKLYSSMHASHVCTCMWYFSIILYI